jgi:hypothetical protein
VQRAGNFLFHYYNFFYNNLYYEKSWLRIIYRWCHLDELISQEVLPGCVRHKQDSEDTKVSHYRQFDSELITVLTSSLYIVGLVPTLIASSMMRMFGRRAS